MASGITPYLLYEDGEAACEFLARAFGFEEVLRSHSPEGRVWHAELRLGDAVLYLGEPAHGYVSPRRAGGTTVSLYCYVDDLDAHFAQAEDAGRGDRRGADRPGLRRPPLPRQGSRGARVLLRRARARRGAGGVGRGDDARGG